MELALKLASIFFTMILVDNYVLAKFLGICPFLGVSKKLDSAVGPCAGTSLCRRSRICFGFCRSCCFLRRRSCGGAVCRRTAG